MNALERRVERLERAHGDDTGLPRFIHIVAAGEERTEIRYAERVGRRYIRQQDESEEEFKARLVAESPQNVVFLCFSRAS